MGDRPVRPRRAWDADGIAAGARIARALRDWKACELPENGYYQMLDADGGDVGAILKAFGVDVTPQAYTKGELIALKSSVSPF